MALKTGSPSADVCVLISPQKLSKRISTDFHARDRRLFVVTSNLQLGSAVVLWMQIKSDEISVHNAIPNTLTLADLTNPPKAQHRSAGNFLKLLLHPAFQSLFSVAMSSHHSLRGYYDDLTSPRGSISQLLSPFMASPPGGIS